MKKVLVILFLGILFSSCQNQKQEEKFENKYDIVISYNHYKTDSSYSRPYMNHKYLRDGNLYIVFESDFEQDTVTIEVNGKVEISEVISTEWSTEVAKFVEFKKINTIDNIGIRINNGNMAFIEIDTMNIFRIIYRDSILQVKIPNNVPIYE